MLPCPTSTPFASTGPAHSIGEWRLVELDEVESTNAVAARLDPWTAVTARTQTAGRGRHGRRWVSDDGGLWLSAVLPLSDDLHRWGILPLAAGWATCHALGSLGIQGLRLRWPNDVMVGKMKLAGILVERFTPATAVVGIGVNCANRPAAVDPALAGCVARVHDLASGTLPAALVRGSILASLRQAHGWIDAGRTDELAARLSPFWANHRVHLTLRGPAPAELECEFAGVDATGRLGIRTVPDATRWLEPAEVEMLREIF